MYLLHLSATAGYTNAAMLYLEMSHSSGGKEGSSMAVEISEADLPRFPRSIVNVG